MHDYTTAIGDNIMIIIVCILYVYCTYYAPICDANGMEKASFARIVGADERELTDEHVECNILTGLQSVGYMLDRLVSLFCF